MANMNNKEEAIKVYMDKLGINREEAEELWQFDNDEITNEAADKIEAEEKAVIEEKQQKKRAEKARKQQDRAVSEVNRENIIGDIFNKTLNSEHVFNCQQMTNTKMSFTDKDGFFYTVQVTKHNKRPSGYDADLRNGSEE